VRSLVPDDRFIEIHVDCDLDTLKKRDPKGLYAKAERGEIQQLTGVQTTYESPVDPELRLHTDVSGVDESVRMVEQLLRDRSLIRPKP
jgi:adenylylsulfate kinase-like enzyme